MAFHQKTGEDHLLIKSRSREFLSILPESLIKYPTMARIILLMILGILINPQLRGQGNQQTLKVMSYNIRHGLGLDSIQDLSRAAAIINNYSPDLCALQEIDQKCNRTGGVDQVAYLSGLTRLQGTFGAFMDYDGGKYGMAVLSALPASKTTVLPLPEGVYEPRTAIIQEVQISEDGSIVFANVHFDWVGSEEGAKSRLQQAKVLVKYLNSTQKAVIITGDFNCTPDSATMKYFEEQGFVFAAKGKDHLSFQGAEKTEIDHLIYRNSDTVLFEIKEAKLLTEPVVSDHRPLVAELTVTMIK